MTNTLENRADLEARGGELYRLALKEGRELTQDERAELANIELTLDRAEYARRAEEAKQRFTGNIETRSQEDSRGPRILTRETRMQDFMRSRFSPDESNLNFGRYLRGVITGDWTGADAEKRAMSVGTLTAGGHLVPTPLSATVIDRLRNAAMVMQAGAVTIPMDTSTLKFARVSGDPTANWVAESGSITATDASFDSVTFTARKLAALVQISVELVEDATNSTVAIENTIAQALALELDRVALHGTGTPPQPAGLASYNSSTIPQVSMGTNGAALANYDPVLDAVYTIIANNATPNAAIMAPRTAQAFAKLKDTTNQPLIAPADYSALNRLASSQVRTNMTQGSSSLASNIFVGDFSQLAIGMRTQLMLEVSREAGTAFANGEVWIRAYLRADVQLLQPKAFATVVGVL